MLEVLGLRLLGFWLGCILFGILRTQGTFFLFTHTWTATHLDVGLNCYLVGWKLTYWTASDITHFESQVIFASVFSVSQGRIFVILVIEFLKLLFGKVISGITLNHGFDLATRIRE